MGAKDSNGKETSRSNLGEYLNRHVAIPNGYKLTLMAKHIRSYGYYVEVKCTRGCAARLGSGSKSMTHTHRSQTDDDVCCFFLPVYYDKNENLFFFKQHCWPMFDHNGHSKVDSNHMKLGKSAVPPETIEIAEQLLGKNCPPAVVQLLLTVMSGQRISQDSLSKMRSAVHISKFRGKEIESTADTLLNMLENEEGVTYCYMTASVDEAMQRVRVRKGKFITISDMTKT